MENFIQGVKNQANKFTEQEQAPGAGQGQPGQALGSAQQGMAQPGAATGGGSDWSSLSKLASHFGAAEQQHGEGIDFSTFASFLGNKAEGNPSNPAQAAQQAGADPSVIDKLLKYYHKETGNTFEEGGGGNFDHLQEIAAKQLGIDVPSPILQKLVKWKLQGMF